MTNEEIMEKLRRELELHKESIRYLLNVIDKIEERFEISEMSNDDFLFYSGIIRRPIH